MKELHDFVLGLNYFLCSGFGPFGVQVLDDVQDILVESWILVTPPRRSNCILMVKCINQNMIQSPKQSCKCPRLYKNVPHII